MALSSYRNLALVVSSFSENPDSVMYSQGQPYYAKPLLGMGTDAGL